MAYFYGDSHRSVNDNRLQNLSGPIENTAVKARIGARLHTIRPSYSEKHSELTVHQLPMTRTERICASIGLLFIAPLSLIFAGLRQKVAEYRGGFWWAYKISPIASKKDPTLATLERVSGRVDSIASSSHIREAFPAAAAEAPPVAAEHSASSLTPISFVQLFEDIKSYTGLLGPSVPTSTLEETRASLRTKYPSLAEKIIDAVTSVTAATPVAAGATRVDSDKRIFDISLQVARSLKEELRTQGYQTIEREEISRDLSGYAENPTKETAEALVKKYTSMRIDINTAISSAKLELMIAAHERPPKPPELAEKINASVRKIEEALTAQGVIVIKDVPYVAPPEMVAADKHDRLVREYSALDEAGVRTQLRSATGTNTKLATAQRLLEESRKAGLEARCTPIILKELKTVLSEEIAKYPLDVARTPAVTQEDLETDIRQLVLLKMEKFDQWREYLQNRFLEKYGITETDFNRLYTSILTHRASWQHKLLENSLGRSTTTAVTSEILVSLRSELTKVGIRVISEKRYNLEQLQPDAVSRELEALPHISDKLNYIGSLIGNLLVEKGLSDKVHMVLTTCHRLLPD